MTCQVSGLIGTPLSEIIAEMPTINLVNERTEWGDDFINYVGQVREMMEQEYDQVVQMHERLLIGTDEKRKLVVRQSPFDSTLRMSAESYADTTVEEMIEQARAIVLPQ